VNTAFPMPEDYREAGRLQRQLAAQVVVNGDPGNVRLLAALDASHKRGGNLVAAAVLWDCRQNRLCEIGLAHVDPDTVFPYVPGYLSFREAPAYLAALDQLSQKPELLLVDGQGIAHPRRLGIASHLGVYLDLPSIGVAKRPLVGKAAGDLEAEAGSAVPLTHKGEAIGWVYRSRTGVKPLYLSPGHRVGLDETLALVRALPTRTKLPEPLRQAHHWAGKARQENIHGRITITPPLFDVD